MDHLACNACKKSFVTGLARDRHQLRCKARPRSRRKACAQCARSKVRCDNGTPACSRCSVLSLNCTYPYPKPTQTSTPLEPSSAIVSRPQSHAPAEPEIRIPSGGEAMQLGNPAAPSHFLGWGFDAGVEWQSDQLVPFLPDPFGLQTPSPLPDTPTINSLSFGTTANFQSGNLTVARPHPYSDLSTLLAERWLSAEQGLELMDRACKGYADKFAYETGTHPFIHFRSRELDRRHGFLASAASIAQLYMSETLRLGSIVLSAMEALLLQIQGQMTKYTAAGDNAALQTVILCSAMRIYRSGHTAAELMNRLEMRLTQHFASKSMHCMTPHARVRPEDWDDWIIEESIRRSSFAFHALDYVSHARKGVPTAICVFFNETPLPCPLAVWEAPTAEDWVREYNRYEDACGGDLLRGREIVSWFLGRETGREEVLGMWFREVGEFGDVILACGRAQGSAANVITE